MLSCPNCGGNLKFDIPSQQLSCEHCHTLFDPYDFDGKQVMPKNQRHSTEITRSRSLPVRSVAVKS
ncbi:Trm112 family protein [Roseburia faecis]|uniref:Trm112 family protein n=1 Tax=Roseburia faecis TaxID=301302 RepID=UPI002FE6F519